MPTRYGTFRFGIRLVPFFLFLLSGIALAQNIPPIQTGQNAIGELTADAPTASYALTASGGETVSIQVLALSQNFVPRFRVLNPSGVEILTAPNPNAVSSLTADASLPDAGVYTIEIVGENGTLGQFVLSLQAGVPLPDAVELTVDQLVSGAVDGDAPLAVYHFVTPPSDPLMLTILTDSPDAGLLISLYDETADKTIATSDATLSGIIYRLPPRESSYRAEIHASDAASTPYTVCLGTCEGSLLTSPPQTPETVAATCAVASANGGTVNIRAGAGTQFAIVGNLAAGQPLPVLGRLADRSWVQVRLPSGVQGWVATSVTRLEGDCAALPVLAAPLNAALAPTQPPAPTLPPPTTASGGGGSTSPTTAPMPTAVPTTEPPPAITLPDLSVTISFAVLSGDTSADIGYSIVVRDVTNPFSYRVEICIDNTCIFEDLTALASSSSGTSRTITFTPEALRIVHRATVRVDSTGDVVESDEGNNVATYNFQ